LDRPLPRLRLQGGHERHAGNEERQHHRPDGQGGRRLALGTLQQGDDSRRQQRQRRDEPEN
jgi:hypothetical protein